MSRLPAPIAIACPRCGATGEIVVTTEVRPSAGFVLDATKMPMCEPCQVPAGLRRRELERLAS